MTKEELASLPAKVRIATEAGKAAAAACTDDGGSANLDRVVIPVPGLRLTSCQACRGTCRRRVAITNKEST